MDASPKQNASDSPTFPHFSISFKTISIPKKVADRLQEYVRSEKIGLNSRIFPICYEAARAVVRKAGNMVGIYLRPHDLRRHAATFAKFQPFLN